MRPRLHPNLTTFDQPQLQLWSEFSRLPAGFILCGGTAVALYLGHRPSFDFDFMGSAPFDPDELLSALPFLQGGAIVQKSERTLTCVVDRDGAVKVSFFGVPDVRLTNEPNVAADNEVQIASMIDLAGMKAAVVQKRAEAKDYVDLDAIFMQSEVNLPAALTAAKAIYGASFNPELTLKSLCYFEDGNLSTLSQEVRKRLTTAVKNVDLEQLPSSPPQRGTCPPEISH